MKRIYISGKITGIELHKAKDNFKKAADYLQRKYEGIVVVDPMKEVPYEKGKTWEQYMIDDIKLLFGCDSIFMLDNWEDSRGARIECNISKEMSKTILFQSALAN